MPNNIDMGGFGSPGLPALTKLNGRLGVGAVASPASALHVTSNSGEIPLIAQGSPNVTANHFETRNSSGGLLTYIDSTGRLQLSTTGTGVVNICAAGSMSVNSCGMNFTTSGVNFTYGGGTMISFIGGNPGSFELTGYNTPIVMGTGPVKGKAGVGTNGAGGNLYLSPGQSTGNATPRTVVLQGTAVGASGSTAQPYVDVLTVTNSVTLTASDAVDLAVGTTTGTKIGTGTTQKLGFWNATPVVQQSAVADATDAASVITQLNSLLAKLRTVGIIAT